MKKLFVTLGLITAFASCSNNEDVIDGVDNNKDKAPSAAKAVDLGLPSGLKWANMNIGATSETGFGDYFAWGETAPKKTYIWQSYLLCNGSSSSMTKYCTSTSYGELVDHKTVLERDNDAASVNWGGKWRMPTDDEFDELIENCYLVCTTNYNNSGISGTILYKAKSNSDKGVIIDSEETPSSAYSLSDTHIFMPAAGRYEDHGYSGDGTYGFYWTSSVYIEKCYGAWRQPFGIDGVVRMKFQSRCYGFTVRAVCK